MLSWELRCLLHSTFLGKNIFLSLQGLGGGFGSYDLNGILVKNRECFYRIQMLQTTQVKQSHSLESDPNVLYLNVLFGTNNKKSKHKYMYKFVS